MTPPTIAPGTPLEAALVQYLAKLIEEEESIELTGPLPETVRGLVLDVAKATLKQENTVASRCLPICRMKRCSS